MSCHSPALSPAEHAANPLAQMTQIEKIAKLARLGDYGSCGQCINEPGEFEVWVGGDRTGSKEGRFEIY